MNTVSSDRLVCQSGGSISDMKRIRRALPLPDDGGIVRHTWYRVFRTVWLKTPQTGGARFDMARREDDFANSVTGPYQNSWRWDRFKKGVQGPEYLKEFDF